MDSIAKRNATECPVQIVKDMYDRSKATIHTPHGHTTVVVVSVEVHEGPALSPFLFLTLDGMTSHLMEVPLKTILYADDIALIEDSREELQGKVQE